MIGSIAKDRMTSSVSSPFPKVSTSFLAPSGPHVSIPADILNRIGEFRRDAISFCTEFPNTERLLQVRYSPGMQHQVATLASQEQRCLIAMPRAVPVISAHLPLTFTNESVVIFFPVPLEHVYQPPKV